MFPSDLRSPNHVGVGTRIAGVVQGYKPQVDWGGDTGSATIVLGRHNVRVATEGWRRRCLYILLILLLIISIVNLSLTLWIFKTVDFSVSCDPPVYIGSSASEAATENILEGVFLLDTLVKQGPEVPVECFEDGMGCLHVAVGGVEMEGLTEFFSKMSAGGLQSRRNSNLAIEGYYNMSLTTTAKDDNIANFLHINTDGVIGGGKRFKVLSGKDKHLLLDASHKHLYVGAEKLTVTGNKGATFEGSVQTPRLVSNDTHLRLQSVTREVKVSAAKEVRVESRSGDVAMAAYWNVTLSIRNGSLRLDNPNIYFNTLKIENETIKQKANTENVTPHPQETQIPAPDVGKSGGGGIPPTTPLPPYHTPPPTKRGEEVRVFQVCVCPSGRLFLAPAHIRCVFEEGICR